MMWCIHNTYTDPYFNLASEEYLLKNFREDIFMLYQNDLSVIVGKHQQVSAEVDIDYAEKNHIKIVRRMSGGGTVFHDAGNLNLTFIESGKSVDFNRFTERIVRMLVKAGVPAVSDSRRTIRIDGLKISGSAQCVYKDRVMYHATLLYSSDLDVLTRILNIEKPLEEVHTDGRVYIKSVKEAVTNMNRFESSPMGIARFKKYVMSYFLNENPENKRYTLNDEDFFSINRLAGDKYITYDWNFRGKTPSVKSLPVTSII